ncbi:MAG: hypothetical protein JO348_09980 [Alphaproteobacteria bacterium]|nr:hypothetical protein [Alphaproteobacteria bacterium]
MKLIAIAAMAATLLVASPALATPPTLESTRDAMIGKWHNNAEDPASFWQFNADGTEVDSGGLRYKWLLFSGAKPPKEATPEAIDVPDKNAIYLELKDTSGVGSLLFYTVAHVDAMKMELDYIHGAGNDFQYFARVTGKPARRPTGY